MFHSEDDATALPLHNVIGLVTSPAFGLDDLPIRLSENLRNIVSSSNAMQKLFPWIQVLDSLLVSPPFLDPPSTLYIMNIKPLPNASKTPRRSISGVHVAVPREVQGGSQQWYEAREDLKLVPDAVPYLHLLLSPMAIDERVDPDKAR